MKNLLTFCAAILALQGCSSIDQPVAQRALVEHEYVDPAQPVDSALATALINAPVDKVMIVRGEQILFGKTFFSASGLTCRTASSNENSERIYCQRGHQDWFQVNRVISEYQAAEELEAK